MTLKAATILLVLLANSYQAQADIKAEGRAYTAKETDESESMEVLIDSDAAMEIVNHMAERGTKKEENSKFNDYISDSMRCRHYDTHINTPSNKAKCKYRINSVGNAEAVPASEMPES